MTKIDDYIRGGGGHFIPVERLPVVPAGTSVSDALSVMRSQGTQGVLVRNRKREYRLLLGTAMGRITWGAASPDPVRTTVEALLGDERAMVTIAVTASRAAASRGFRGRRPFRAIGVVDGGKVVGLLTEAEDFGAAFFTRPVVCSCPHGHNYYPPAAPSKCLIDGDDVTCG